MKKKIVLLGMTVLLVFGICGCAGKNDTQQEDKEQKSEYKTLYEQGLEVVSLMGDLAGSDAYMEAVAPGDIRDFIEIPEETDFTAPKAVYKITLSLLDAEWLELLEIDSAEMPDTVDAYMKQKMSGAIINILNAQGGAKSLAAAGTLAVTKAFVCDEEAENVIYLYTYDNSVPAAVSFIPGENGAVIAQGMFLFSAGLEMETPEDIEEFFEGFPVEVEDVTK